MSQLHMLKLIVQCNDANVSQTECVALSGVQTSVNLFVLSIGSCILHICVLHMNVSIGKHE